MRSPPVFVLTCMRSYSSLVCSMLGQHPQMYSLPEVNLFVADRVGELMEIARAVRPTGLHGLLRTLAQLQYGNQTEATVDKAKAWLARNRGASTKQVFELIMEAVQPRICVEKSPSTVLRREFLARLIRAFPDARIIHLTRHPRPTCRSIFNVMSDTDQQLGLQRVQQTDIEGLWRRAHENILSLGKEVGTGQYIRLQGEAFLNDVDGYFPQLAEWLGISATALDLEAILHPERSVYARFGPANARLGNDPGFLKNPCLRPRKIEESSLEGPLEWQVSQTSYGLSDESKQLARRFGYR